MMLMSTHVIVLGTASVRLPQVLHKQAGTIHYIRAADNPEDRHVHRMVPTQVQQV